MDKFNPNKKKRKKKKINAVAIITAVFFAIGISLIVISSFNDIVSWLAKCGIALLVILLIPIIWIVHTVINDKIGGM